MTRKKVDRAITRVAPTIEDTAQVEHLLEQFHQVARELRASTKKEEAEAVLTDINGLAEASQVALLKALSKERDSDAADIAIALNELSPHKSIRKEARRSLIRLEEARVYPRWKPPVAHTPAISIPVAHPPRFWKGYVSLSREEGEVQLALCWEQGVDYGEVRMLTFLLDFWEQGLKDFISEQTNKRNVESRLQQMRAQLPDVTLTDCTLAEGRRLVEEALSVNAWRGTTPIKEYRRHQNIVKQLVIEAEDVDEDRGLTFINPKLESDEVVATFVTAWALGDYGLDYDLLASDSRLREGLERDEWIERRRAWANEARPSRFELIYIREREVSAPLLWLPSSVSGRGASSRKEVEIGWSLELSDTQLSGTLQEMPMGTAVYKETGRHWFWTSYTLVREHEGWRMQQMVDEGANAQSLTIAELQQHIEEHDQSINELMQQHVSEANMQELAEELLRRMTQTIYYDDALIVHLPLDRTYYGDAYNRATGIGAIERAIVYLERLARHFAEQRGEILRQLAISQSTLGEYYGERGMDVRARHFAALAEASIRESLSLQDGIAGHAVLAELLMKQEERLDEAEAELYRAKELATSSSEEAMLENDLGSLAIEQTDLEKALRHYQRVAEIDPNFEGVWFKIGFAQRNLKRFAEAKASYLRAIEREPQDMHAYSELCAIYMNEQEPGKAREIVERGLSNIPKSAHLLTLLSSIYLDGGDMRRAQAILAQAEEIDEKLEIVQSLREELNRRLKK
jgi:tetratricopeptide (TPR) repeat protein